ncbi:MAG: hypothetical protein ACW9XA_05695 [Candidatus Nitrosopumilus sp. bin_6a]
MITVTQEEYSKLCEKYDFFKKIGFEGFETKIWLVFKALVDEQVSVKSVAKNPCQSLMENDVPFHNIRDYLDQLSNDELLVKLSGGNYILKDDRSYELHRICYQITSKIVKTKAPLHTLIKDCGYVYDTRNVELVRNFNNGDINAKENTFNDLMTQLAFAGARLLTKIVVHIDEKIPEV